MQISISTRHGDLSAGTREKISEKVQKLSRLFDRLTAINVTADLEDRCDSVECEVEDGRVVTVE